MAATVSCGKWEAVEAEIWTVRRVRFGRRGAILRYQYSGQIGCVHLVSEVIPTLQPYRRVSVALKVPSSLLVRLSETAEAPGAA